MLGRAFKRQFKVNTEQVQVETRLMKVDKKVFIELCELYQNSALIIKEMALEKSRIKQKLFEMVNNQNSKTGQIPQQSLNNISEIMSFFKETITQIHKEQSLKLSALSHQQINHNVTITKSTNKIKALE